MKLVVKSLVCLLACLWMPFMADGRQVVSLTSQILGMERLTAEDFHARFGKNTQIPRTDEAILTLARELFPSREEKQIMVAGPVSSPHCGRTRLGRLISALRSPAVSDDTRRQVALIINKSIPTLNRTLTRGHFRFYYTDNDTDEKNNVTLTQIKSTAYFLNQYWNTYTGPRFKNPKHYVDDGRMLIDILVFYIDEETYGETCDLWDCILLNSKLAVADDCRRRTASAHQLFHRVEYSYGLMDGMADTDWLAEGSSGYSQKWTNPNIWDYLDLMNEGLDGWPLLFRDESATPFFVYETSRFGEDWSAVRDIWTAFGVNGHKAVDAVDVVVWKRFKLTFDQFVRSWFKANYLKDFLPLSTYTKYPENTEVHTTCGRIHGPLKRVAVNTSGFARNRISSGSGMAFPYGADYWEFNIAGDVETISLNVRDYGDSSSYHFYGIYKGGASYRIIKEVVPTPGGSLGIAIDNAQQYSKIAMVVCGNGKGASFQFWGTGD
jgi:hypothetical protein